MACLAMAWRAHFSPIVILQFPAVSRPVLPRRVHRCVQSIRAERRCRMGKVTNAAGPALSFGTEGHASPQSSLLDRRNVGHHQRGFTSRERRLVHAMLARCIDQQRDDPD